MPFSNSILITYKYNEKKYAKMYLNKIRGCALPITIQKLKKSYSCVNDVENMRNLTFDHIQYIIALLNTVPKGLKTCFEYVFL